MNEEQTFQNLMLAKLLEPSDTELVLKPDGTISTLELIVNKLLQALKTVENGKDHIGLFQVVRDTSCGKPEEFRTVRYESNEFSDVLRAAQKIIDQGE